MSNIIEDDDEGLLVDDFEDANEEAPEGEEPTDAGRESEAGVESAKSGEPEEEEIESYSKRVQKRINKLTHKVRQFEQETNYWKEKVEALEKKTSAKEFADFQSQVELSSHQIQSQIDAARAAKKAAIEEGDIDAQIKADEQMLELREQLAEKKRLAISAKEQATKFQETAQQPPQRPSENPTIPDHLPDGTKQWLKSNAWFLKGSDQKAAEFARALDATLQEEGFSPEDPAMYAELDKRLRVLVPRLAKAGASPPIKTPPRSRVAGSSTDGQRPEGTSSKPTRKLTAESLVSMRRFGMDPNKPEHRKAWLHRNDPL